MQRRPGIEVAPPSFAVLERQQDLGHRDGMRLEQFLVGMCKPDLADSRRGLAFLEAQRARRQAEMAAAERDRAGGHENDFLPALAQPHEVFGQRLEPRAVEPTGGTVDEQC